MEILEIIFLSLTCWPFVIGFITGGGIGAILSILTTGEVNIELSASLSIIFAIVSTFVFGDFKKKDGD